MLKFSLFLNDTMNDLLGITEKTHCFVLRNIITIQFCSKYFDTRTKIERALVVLLRLRKCV